MKFVIAPDSFKGSLNALEVAKAIEHGFQIHFPKAEYIVCPMADGGEGTLNCLVPHNQFRARVKNPLGEMCEANYGILEDGTAVIEMAEASGISLIPKKNLNPLLANTVGTGELIKIALDKGCRKFIIGLGGSATTDAGMGALTALGLQFKNNAGETLIPNGRNLSEIHEIITKNLDARLQEAEFILAHDVNNPLLGLEGALMYAPQKGATVGDIALLHKGFEQFSYVASKMSGKMIGTIVGGGAAGGLGAGLYAFLNAKFVPGAEIVSESLHLKEKMKNATLVITGEGQIDTQTAYGKVPCQVAHLAKELNIPVIALCGNIKDGFEVVYHHGINAVFSITTGPMTQKRSMVLVKSLLINTANNLARLLKLQLTSYAM